MATLRITLGVHRAKVHNPEADAYLSALISALSFYDVVRSRDQGRAIFTTRYDHLTHTFPVGLVSTLIRSPKLADVGVDDFDIEDTRVLPAQPDLGDGLDWLREYQLDAVRELVRRPLGIVKAPTGAGKGEVIAGLVKAIPIRWLVLQDSKDLVRMNAERIEARTGEDVGTFVEGKFRVLPTARVVCAGYQALHSAAKAWRPNVAPEKLPPAARLFDWAQGIIYDEVQSAAAPTATDVITRCRNAVYRYGLSATPFGRSDGREMDTHALFGDLVYEVRTPDLIASGHVAAPDIRMVRVKHEIDDQPGARYDEAYAFAIQDNPERNLVAIEMCRRAPKPAIMFVQRIKHGQSLAKALTKAGLRTTLVHGKAKQERAHAAARVAQGQVDVVVANKVFQAGVDMPSLRSVIIVGAGRSSIQTIQQVGRGSRLWANAETGEVKNRFVVYDIFDDDSGDRVLPDGRKIPTKGRMHEQAKARHRAYRHEGFEVTVMQYADFVASTELTLDDARLDGGTE